MNKEQLLETLKGLTTALEAATTTIPASGEDLRQAFYAGARFVLEDLLHSNSESKEVSWSISPEDGHEEYGSVHLEFSPHDMFMSGRGYYDASYQVQHEKYVESIDTGDISNLLEAIGLKYEPAAEPTETTNPETPTA